jgi:predicted DNA-binding protein YlxM (UPF0122 family)
MLLYRLDVAIFDVIENLMKTQAVVKKLYNDRDLSIQEICDLMKISRTTLYDYLREN